jgi:hypothetical protein
VLEYLARMGLSMRDDPPKVIDPAGRTWGRCVDGLALSIEPVNLREDARARSNISVVLRNTACEPRSLTVPGWLNFYRLHIRDANGNAATLSPFGAERLDSKHHHRVFRVTLAPDQISETQLPIASIFQLRPGVRYRAKVSCKPDNHMLESNEIEIEQHG